MVHYNSCPICFSSEISLRLNCIDHFKTNESFPIYTCAICGISFTQDHPDEDNIGYYYESDNYISHGQDSRGIVNSIYRIVRTLTLKRKRQIVERESKLNKGSLLDIGSGTGHFAAEMKKSDWNVKCVEINETAREHSILKFGLEALHPSEISNLHDAEFDCITLWHVLEHLDLNKYLSEIRRLLKPGGTCIIAVPNIASYDAKYYKKYWAAYDVPRHLWHFQPETLAFVTESRNFKLMNTRLLPLDVFYISTLSEQYKKTPAPFLTGLAKGTFFAIKTLFNKKCGSSLIYVLN